MDARDLAALRRGLADARHELRQAQDRLQTVRAQAEQRAVDAAGGDKALGANEQARARALVIALDGDPDYGQALAGLRDAESLIDHLEAEIEIARDERREREWRVRGRLVDALERQPAATDDRPDPRAEHAFDGAATERLTHLATARAGSSFVRDAALGWARSSLGNPGGPSDDGEELPF